ncbi:sulfotransferase [Gloeocapsa sp. PCC 7428]|uniref:sulfotransferase domain-containing protein n=1 Tax=Gloeocapsa sp. PCC 7428 TaxID=1173026 RepID=UPI0002A60E68|nr:sulfotransferase domain-containing protein [Gloeocapsa sp. PCC 7428]AFZ29828.1 sulfotransferase [Gloeocapsa sp. PCC 7428]
MNAYGSFLTPVNDSLNKIKYLVYGKYYHHPYLFPRVTSEETYLISFPRSGNTWLRRLLTALIHKEKAGWQLMESTVPDIHIYKPENKKKPSIKPLIVKSHTPFVDIPAKVVYVVRDGRDALLSYYFLLLKEGKIKPDTSILDIYFDNNIWPCPWHKHIAGWLNGLEKRSSESYKIIYYEDLKKTTAEQLFSVAEFIGLPVTLKDAEQAIALHPVRNQSKSDEVSSNQENTDSVIRKTKLKWQDILVGENLVKYEAIAGAELQRLGYPLMSLK